MNPDNQASPTDTRAPQPVLVVSAQNPVQPAPQPVPSPYLPFLFAELASLLGAVAGAGMTYYMVTKIYSTNYNFDDQATGMIASIMMPLLAIFVGVMFHFLVDLSVRIITVMKLKLRPKVKFLVLYYLAFYIASRVTSPLIPDFKQYIDKDKLLTGLLASAVVSSIIGYVVSIVLYKLLTRPAKTKVS